MAHIRFGTPCIPRVLQTHIWNIFFVQGDFYWCWW